MQNNNSCILVKPLYVCRMNSSILYIVCVFVLYILQVNVVVVFHLTLTYSYNNTMCLCTSMRLLCIFVYVGIVGPMSTTLHSKFCLWNICYYNISYATSLCCPFYIHYVHLVLLILAMELPGVFEISRTFLYPFSSKPSINFFF